MANCSNNLPLGKLWYKDSNYNAKFVYFSNAYNMEDKKCIMFIWIEFKNYFIFIN